MISPLKEFINKWWIYALAIFVWALIFRQVSRLPFKTIALGGTDFWFWVFIAYWALATGWAFFPKDKDK